MKKKQQNSNNTALCRNIAQTSAPSPIHSKAIEQSFASPFNTARHGIGYIFISTGGISAEVAAVMAAIMCIAQRDLRVQPASKWAMYLHHIDKKQTERS